jgi:parvulin-like peptidyl-prolyl isomerase
MDETKKENLGRVSLIEKGHYPDFDDVVFAMQKEGEISDPFKTSRGWAIIKVEQIEVGKTPTLQEAFGDIKTTLMEEKAELLLQEKLNKWREDYIVVIHEDNLDKVVLQRLRI